MLELILKSGIIEFMKKIYSIATATFGFLLLALFPLSLQAHCDAWDGPIISEAQKAFQQGDITPVLKWIPAEHELELKQVFNQATEVAKLDAKANTVAETWFLETLIRLHREGEGAPYTGLKPAGQTDKAVALADAALITGSAESLAELIGQAVSQQILTRFEEAERLKKTASENVEQGRAFVEAYVSYVHFVESVHALLSQTGHSH